MHLFVHWVFFYRVRFSEGIWRAVTKIFWYFHYKLEFCIAGFMGLNLFILFSPASQSASPLYIYKQKHILSTLIVPVVWEGLWDAELWSLLTGQSKHLKVRSRDWKTGNASWHTAVRDGAIFKMRFFSSLWPSWQFGLYSTRSQN